MALRTYTIDNATVAHNDNERMIDAATLARLAGMVMAPDDRLVCEHCGGKYAPSAPVNLSLYGGKRKFALLRRW